MPRDDATGPPTPPARGIVAVEPMPPRAPGRLPWVGSGLALVRNPTRFFAETRRALGDTYVVDAFGYRRRPSRAS